MTQPRTCPECHAEFPTDAPPGVCPYCALRAGLRWDAATQPDRQPGPDTPLAPEALSRWLPELEDFELIGPGGMGNVYKARHRELDRLVAVKVLHQHLQQDDVAFAARFVREARTLARLNHPYIVRVYDVGHREQIYYLVMEFVEGMNLRQAMTTAQFTPAQPSRWCRGYARRFSTPTIKGWYTASSSRRTSCSIGRARRRLWTLASRSSATHPRNLASRRPPRSWGPRTTWRRSKSSTRPRSIAAPTSTRSGSCSTRC